MSEVKDRATRDGFGEALLAEATHNERVVVVSCDLSSATRVKPFGEKYPNRFFEVGIAEQNGISIAAGLGLTDLRPFITSFGAFITSRYDQIRTSCAYSQAPVVIVGTHSGLAIGKDGTTQMGLEDLNIMAAIPGMHIYQPADAVEAEQIVKHLAETSELAYLRLSRTPQPAVYDNTHVFRPGYGHIIREGGDVALVATGDSVYHCLQAAEQLSREHGIEATVVNISTLKPIDRALIKQVGVTVPHLIAVEDHNIIGGLGSRVCEVVAEEGLATKVTRHGVPDRFGESGDPKDLYRKYNLDAEGIIETARNTVGVSKNEVQPVLALSTSSKQPKISYHVVTWNRLPKLKNMLRSFIACNQYENYEFLVIDHGSTDGTQDFLRTIEKNPEYEALRDHIKPIILDEQEYIAELKQKGIEISSPRRAGQAFFGYYRNYARSVADGDYFIDIPDDHQFIRPVNWVEELLAIHRDRLRQVGRDDISSLVFKTRRLYRILKKNQATEPKVITPDTKTPYYVCRYKGYDDYGMVSRTVFEQMGPYFQIDHVDDPTVIAAWNDPENEYFNTTAPHYVHYLKRSQQLNLNKVMTKYPYTHDLMNDRDAVSETDFAVPLTTTRDLRSRFRTIDRPVSFEEVEHLLTGEPSTWPLLKTKIEAKARSLVRAR